MMGLLDIIRGEQKIPTKIHATATDAISKQDSKESVAKIAVAPSSLVEKSYGPDGVSPDPDRYCWPNSSAMNTVEIDLFIHRLAMFRAKGLGETTSEELADKLVIRDRESDDRKVCFECSHLKGFTLLRCDNWKAAGICSSSENAFVGKSFCSLLQRCDGFSF